MSSANNANFTRGSQLWAHNMRMVAQGIKNICLVGLGFVLVLLMVRCYQLLTFESVYYYIIQLYAEFKVGCAPFFAKNYVMTLDYYSLSKGMFINIRADQFVYDFWSISKYSPVINEFKYWVVTNAVFEIIITFIIGCALALGLFVYRGRDILGIKKLRGSELTTVPDLKKILKKARVASKINISGLPLVKDSETQHFLLTGTTGSGKTNMLNELLPQIRKQNNRAIIFDVTGEFVDRFFNPETDVILNPLQANSAKWLPWNDCHTDEEYNNLAAAFVDGESIKSDRYWEDAARSVLVEALKKEKDTKSIQSMLNIINRAELHDFCDHFKDTDAAGYVSKEAEKGTASVRSTLTSKIERLKHLEDGGEFSIKNWVNNGNEQGWLFITSTPNDLDTLRPLISAWANIAIKGILDRPHSADNDKMWFIMDELPAMQKIPSLSMALAQGRKYGACMVAGIQNIAQLEQIYGRSGSQELLDLFRTRFFFAVSDNHIAEYASRSLGEIEINETKESVSYGSNTMRDGVSINSVDKMKRLVLPDEVKNLAVRTCFVKLCGNYPITKLTVNLQAPSKLLKFAYDLFGSNSRNKIPQNIERTAQQQQEVAVKPSVFEINEAKIESQTDQETPLAEENSSKKKDQQERQVSILAKPELVLDKKQKLLSEIKD